MPRRKTPPTETTPLCELWNLSALTSGWIEELGIRNYGELCRCDPFWLWSELKVRHPQVSKLMYYAIWGAIWNRHWNEIPESEKEAFEVFRAGGS